MLESVSVKFEETSEYFCNVLLLLLGTFSTLALALAFDCDKIFSFFSFFLFFKWLNFLAFS